MSTPPPGMLRLVPRRSDVTAFCVAALVIVLAFGLVIAKTHAMVHADLGVSKALNTWHVGFFGKLGTDVYLVFSPPFAIAITVLIVVGIVVVTRNLRLGATFAVIVAASWLSSAVVKALVHRSRPDPTALIHHLAKQPTDASYPSGHMVFVASLALACTFLTRGKAYQRLVIATSILVVVVVGLALVSDGVHYLTDVLASIVWSLGAAPLVLMLWNRYALPRTYRTPASVEPFA